MVNIAIVDDEESERLKLKKNFDDLARTTDTQILCRLYESGVSFLRSFQAQFDIICLDIDMPNKNGIDTATEVRKQDRDVMILFITNMAQMAIRGYEVNAFDFIVKPINSYAFSLKMRNALNALQLKNTRSIVIQTASGFHKISTEDLCYVEVYGHYIIYHTIREIFRQKGTMREIQLRLEGLPFALCNQSYLVNLSYVCGIQAGEVKVGETWLKISRPKRKQFLENVSNFLGGFYS